MFHVKHDNSLNKPTTPTTTQNPYGEAHPKKHTPSKYTHRKRITKKQSRIMTDREVEPHSSNSQKELPTILRFHVKHQLLGNNGRKTVLKNHPPQLNHSVLRFTWNTLPALRRHKTMFHVKQPNRHKLSEDAICCSTAPHSFSAFHVKQLVCCRDAMFHVKHSAEDPPNPQWHSAAFQPAYPWCRFHC